jgi:hypothetical protein
VTLTEKIVKDWFVLEAGSVDRYQKVYFACFVLSTVICFSPLKGLAYVTPYICLGLMLTLNSSFERMLSKIFVVLLLVLGSCVMYYTMYTDFVLARFCLGLITFSAVIPLVFFEPRRLNNQELLNRMFAFAKLVLVIQATIGIVQAIYGATQTGSFDASNGDYVEGTIDLPLESSRSFSNPIYAVNMVLLATTFFLSKANGSNSLTLFTLVSASVILASVVHLLLFLALALILAFALKKLVGRHHPRPTINRKPIVTRVIFGLLVFGVLALLIGGNLSNIWQMMELQLNLALPKAIITADALSLMPHERPMMLLFGLGPGQFCSRAGVIATGEYLRGFTAFKTNDPDMFLKYLRPLLDMVLMDERTAGGSSIWPWYSWLTVYTELGVLAVLLILLALFCVVASATKRLSRPIPLSHYALAVLVGTLVIAFLGIQENYWEIPQAILPGILLLQVVYGRMKYGV